MQWHLIPFHRCSWHWQSIAVILVFLGACLTNGNAFARQPLMLMPGDTYIPLGKHLDFLEDPNGKLAIAEISSPAYATRFKQNTMDVLNLGFTASSWWLRIELNADLALNLQQAWLLEIQYPLLNWVDIYLIDDNGEMQVQQGGNMRPFSSRAVASRHINYLLKIEPGAHKTLFINIRTEGSAIVPLMLWRQDVFAGGQPGIDLLMGLYFGGILAMLVINLMTLMTTRDLSFAYYLLHLASIGLFFFAVDGYLFQYVFPNQPLAAKLTILFVTPVTCFAMLQFCRSFLDLRRHIPIANTLVNSLCIIPIVAIILALYGSYRESLKISVAFSVFITITIFVLAVWALKNGWKPARFFLLGWSVLLTGVMAVALSAAGLIPSNLLTNHGVQLASFIEFMVMSYALVDRLRILHQENQKIQRDAMTTLEMRVAKRTSELADAREQAERASRYKSTFIAQLSHEIRTPMNAILGLTYLALNTDLTHRQRSYLENVKRAASVLLGILSDILDFSKIEAGKLELDRTVFKFDQILDNVTAATALRAREKGLELIIWSDPAIPSTLVGDPTRIAQVILNLVNNAIKFTDRGEVIVRIEARPILQQSVELAVSVRDTGIGLSQEQMKRLFRSFEQADQSTTRRYGGTGLGLAISKELVEAMGGRVNVQSEPARGSTFSFTVPLELPDSGKPSSPYPDLTGRRIMVVDRNPIVRSALAEQLQHRFAEVICTASMPEALKFLELGATEESSGRSYDLVLLDAGLSEESALAAIRALPWRAPPAICLLYGQAGEDTLSSHQASGICHFLSKPVTPHELQRLLADVFLNRQAIPQHATASGVNHALSSLSGITILVAEDNDINQQVVCSILEEAGAICDVAADGEEAVRLALDPARHYDLVLMDLQMPELDGMGATLKIRQRIGRGALPLIALTAHSLESERQLCLKLGMNDYLTKPIDPPQLLAAVAHWVNMTYPGTSAAGDELGIALPGFEDLAGALQRVNGNSVLLRRLLATFHARFADFQATFQNALESGNHAEAVRLVHSLQSVSSTLGAISVAAAAAECEHALRTDRHSLNPALLSILIARLAPALETSNEFQQLIQIKKWPARPDPDRAISARKFGTALQTLNRLTKMKDLRARDAFADLRTSIARLAGAKLAEELQTALDRFDYDAVLLLLDRLPQEQDGALADLK